MPSTGRMNKLIGSRSTEDYLAASHGGEGLTDAHASGVRETLTLLRGQQTGFPSHNVSADLRFVDLSEKRRVS